MYHMMCSMELDRTGHSPFPKRSAVDVCGNCDPRHCLRLRLRLRLRTPDCTNTVWTQKTVSIPLTSMR